MTENVYALAAKYYKCQSEASEVLPLNLLERYLRKLAWQKKSEEELLQCWLIIRSLTDYICDQNLEGLGYLTIFDYQEILFRYQEEHADFKLEAEPVHDFLQVIENFYKYLAAQGFDDYSDFMQEVEESLYVNDMFLMPDRRPNQEFYRLLEVASDDNEAEVRQLNQALDHLLKQMGHYFSTEQYRRDNERALHIFCGPAFEIPDLDQAPAHPDESDNSFWLSYWDYFIFDYHLLKEDITPITYYFLNERQQHDVLEKDILRDLIQARFTVFYMEAVSEEVAVCRDLFTDETFELPLPDLDIHDYKHRLFYGHMHTRGVLLLNYVTSLMTTPKLRLRIREVVMRQYRSFQLQEPEASLADFFRREAAAVRHIMNIMSDYAQLNMLPLRKKPPVVKAKPELAEKFRDEGDLLVLALQRVGFSKYDSVLLTHLWEDALAVYGEEDFCREHIPELMTAVLFLFVRLNGYELTAESDLYEIFASDRETVQSTEALLTERLKLEHFDPRYLTESGFVLSLYL